MIEIRNLHHHYPDGTRALKGIDLTIPEGEFLLICGPNGSGKTTLIRLICGLLKPTSGSILINGLDSQRLHRKFVVWWEWSFKTLIARLLGRQ